MKIKKFTYADIILAVLMVLWGLLIFYPFYNSILVSFMTQAEFMRKPFSIFDNYSPLYISIFMDVEKIDDNGNKYYLIRNEFSDYYIDSKTGLVIKITDISQSSISDLYYVFGTVENNDINRPDV